MIVGLIAAVVFCGTRQTGMGVSVLRQERQGKIMVVRLEGMNKKNSPPLLVAGQVGLF